jgi:exoribonuclease-2
VVVTLVGADTVHGFIDFEYRGGVGEHKLARQQRKREAAVGLRGRVGEVFDAVVTGASPKATWVRVADPAVEGRLVRGRGGLRPGDGVRVVLLAADPARGHIDFARE